MARSFVALILSHGRPDDLITLKNLQKAGYTGEWRIVIDDEDPTGSRYVEKYGADQVVIFSKQAIAATFDTADLSPDRRTVAFARNACWQIAADLGADYFLQLDDDYTHFAHRFEKDGALHYVYVQQMDRLVGLMLDWLESSGAAAVAFGQGGDFIGGVASRNWERKVLRKAMNTFFCRTSDTWRFAGRVNEDVNTYVALSHRGLLFLTTLYTMCQQVNTQQQPGGMSDVYLDAGTYAKSFYTVMMCPSAVKVGVMQDHHPRIHHRIDWDACAPKIIRQEHRA